MTGLFGIIVLLFVLLITYWWSNQGFFSAILHCVCVILAGALAFALWEPVVLGFVINGSSFDNYSWGMALGLMFFLFLLLFRVTSDILIPFDIPIPQPANVIGGAAAGFIAGVLTIGMTLISCGFVQGPTELMGFIGWARHNDAKGAPKQINTLLVPVTTLTANFYKKLSIGSLAPSGKYALATHFPLLDETALSLHRDTFRNGDARVSIAPKDVTVEKTLLYDPHFQVSDAGPGAYAVDFTVTTSGFDHGEQFVLSSSQAKLANTEANPKVVFPIKFLQPMENGESKMFSFEDTGNYATSIPGQQDVKITLLFSSESFLDKSKPPTAFYLKGLRFQLSPPTGDTDLAALFASNNGSEVATLDLSNPDGGYLRDVSDYIKVYNSIRPVQLNINLADSISVATSVKGNFLSKGKGVYKKGSALTISRSQRILGFAHGESTEIIMVDVSRTQSGIDMWGDRSDSFKKLGRDVALELVDSLGKGYKPVGYVWERINDVEIFIDPGKPFQKISELPPQPSSGENKLKLVFIVPSKTSLVGIRIGKTLIGTCAVVAKEGQTD